MHLYVDDHHGPHHEAVMVRALCIVIDENRFSVFTVEGMCHLVEYLCTIYIYMKLHLYMAFHEGLSCALPMIIVRYMYTTILYSAAKQKKRCSHIMPLHPYILIFHYMTITQIPSGFRRPRSTLHNIGHIN